MNGDELESIIRDLESYQYDRIDTNGEVLELIVKLARHVQRIGFLIEKKRSLKKPTPVKELDR